jgi:hypothetical protein
MTAGRPVSRQTAGMAKATDHFWDLDSCGWVKHDLAGSLVEIPAQPRRDEPAGPTGMGSDQEGDVRSG